MKHRNLVSVFVLLSVLLGMAFAAPAQAAPGHVCQTFHTVERGENLFRIALRYGTTMAELQSLNAIQNPNLIYAGQVLCVKTGASGGTTYVVQPGDWLAKIARRFGVNTWVLAQVNNLVNSNLIYVGQVLTIPDVTIQ